VTPALPPGDLPPALAGAAHAQMSERVDTWAVSSEAPLAGEIFARAASQGRFGFAEIRDRVRTGKLGGIDPRGLARMAKVLAIQLSEPQHDDFVIDALRAVLHGLPKTQTTLQYRKLLVEMLFGRGEYAEVRRILSDDPVLAADFHGYLAADAINPFQVGTGADHDAWLEAFNRPFAAHGLAPVTVEPGADRPFDTLRAPGAGVHPDGPLISVILTTYNPDPVEIETSLRSILDQTWRNLEVLLIDDCSPSTDPALLERLANRDKRIRLIRLERNGGTYRARNAGLRAARGDFITGQDTDDWSHPQRLARQVDLFAQRPHLAGVMTKATRVNDRLVRTARGLAPDRGCEVSLMVRREDALAVGGYLPVRKGADSEFRERVEHWTGARVGVVQQPLYMIRLSTGSLSRSDFRPGWNHPMRRGFRNAYRHWHATASRGELATDNVFGPETLPFCAPPTMRGAEYVARRYDLCFVADWRRYSTEVRSALDEIRAALAAGLSVAVLQRESPYAQVKTGTPLVAAVQQLVNDGAVTIVYAQGPDSVRTVIVRDPAVIHLGRRDPLGLDAERVLMVGHDGLSSADPRRQTYDPASAHQVATDVFGVVPEWTVTRNDALADFGREFGVPVTESAYPLVVDARWTAHRPVPASAGPGPVVLGRRSGTLPEDWPATTEETTAAYPTDGSADVRMLGPANPAVAQLGLEALPPSWLVFGESEIDPLVFWRTADFMVQFDQRTGGRGHDRDLLEAVAAGTVVITGPECEPPAGLEVCAARADTVAEAISDFRNDPDRYLRQAEAGQRYVRENHGGERFVDFIRQYVGSEKGIRK
jgi:glycosyltransferase involved in cell wall biosynthesis